MTHLLKAVNEVSRTQFTEIKKTKKRVQCRCVMAGPSHDIYIGTNTGKFYIIENGVVYVCK